MLQSKNPLILMLLASSVIAALTKDRTGVVIILAVVLISAVVGYVQESRSDKAFQPLARAVTAETTVVQVGEAQRVSAAELAPGDTVALQSGGNMLADARLVRSRSLQFAEAGLTG